MKNACLVCLIVLMPWIGFAQSIGLMPVPKSYSLGNGKFRVNQDFKIGIYGPGSERLDQYATRTLGRINGRTGKFILQPAVHLSNNPSTPHFTIRYKEFASVALGMDESYELVIGTGSIELNAPTDIGAMRGLETLLQLLEADAQGFYFPQIKIVDAPRFPWRGLLIDVCRHFMPVDAIKRNIDGLAAVKMNVLHLHLTEDQGFRVESKKHPKLHEKGSDGLYYTQNQLKDIVQYAQDRGIRVVPEFDLPGHATSWVVGYPELASENRKYSIERHFGVFDPTLDPTKKTTYDFLTSFLGEMAEVFPEEYWHIGGDENNGNQWNKNEDIQAFMAENNLADNHALQSYFNNQLLGILGNLQKKMVGWDEVFQPNISKDIVIQSWRGRESMMASAQQGYQTILSNGYYLDLAYNAEAHYLNDPIPAKSGLSKEEQSNILGGEATMWSELVTNETIDSRIWPRTAAIAERLWSRRSVRDLEDMYKRLHLISYQLEEVGLLHLRNKEMMMRRVSRNQNIEPLRVFVNVIEPLKGYDRHKTRNFTSYDPLTLIADIATPDAPDAHKFNLLVAQFKKNPNNRSLESEILTMLNKWQANYNSLINLMHKAPALHTAEPLANELKEIAQIGIQAVSHNQPHSQEWKEAAFKQLEGASSPVVGCKIAIIDSVKILIELAK